MAKARVLTRSELAEHLGVDKKMVTKWERSGMPVHTRGRGVASQFRLREVRAWLKVREAKAKAAEKAKVRYNQKLWIAKLRKAAYPST